MPSPKWKAWFKRYLPLEITGTITALLGAFLASALLGNEIVIAYAGTWGENVGFYGYAGGREVREYLKRTAGKTGVGRTVHVFFKSIRNILLEFGPSETLDSFVLRPFFMYIFQVLFENLAVGVIVGKIAADIVFYCIAICSYECRKWYLGE